MSRFRRRLKIHLGGAAAPFSPSDISGLIGWWKADTGVTLNGSNVAAIADQSGNSNNLIQATAGAQPPYAASDADYGGVPSIQPASGDYLATSGTISYGDFTFAMVVKNSNNDAHFTNHQDGGGGRDFIYANTGPSLYKARAGNTFSKDVSSTWGNFATPKTLLAVMDNTTPAWTLRINGAAQTLSDVTSQTPGTTAIDAVMQLGANAGGSFNIIGSYPEVVLYNRVLTAGEISNLESYLRTRYGHY